ncbi:MULTISPECIES: glutamate synthase large subunit [unclassified Cryobacterium]|uniref:glutamate synthase large subunit n=1 Tax=unclassified Cryobacterium TaxID=2649013 RepID=UPI001068F839|nr:MULTISPECIES: glutamate synthase large subunit [unclassified Cryobacterium]MDY7527878.1 glutamate synthase large subunit [Cryobacterium sp. 10C2]MDY7556354.1 glutamate synthase large subunit [Cryobacterium sp. 10C3]MEB0001400.1 glutamate synthase large subunit [Cryobacterium sp. RTC2.1]MEB0202273.1 glutamate synthase large subunit [Cryobacterium sp. 5I3]MEB0289615.1 glutamate synthase large subunit [Cryobacterium sp. 10C2]
MPQSPLFSRFSTVPQPQGLYNPADERDACGLAMVATLRGTAGHDIITIALDALRNLEHRGAVGSDAGTGDGAGIITQIPHDFLSQVVEFELPAAGRYAVGNVFLPTDPTERSAVKRQIGRIAQEECLEILGWREVPVRPDEVGNLARAAMPAIQQLFVQSSRTEDDGERVADIALDRQTVRLRKRAERELETYFASLSCRTLVYKGMVTTLQLEPFYPDLSDPRFVSKLALVHSRYSTNTFPSWPLAQPFRMIAHNGEINTVQGNRNWMRARQSQLESSLLGDLAPLLPIVTPGGSDSASFDEVVELLSLSGRSLPHAVMMMVPEAWENQTALDEERRAFYEYHSMLMEPWDGPAAIVFTDGSLVGATLDRNGLRPGRYLITDDGLVVLASEIGVLDIDPARVVRKGRLRPGKMFLVDTVAGRLIEDDEIKAELAAMEPWGDWLDAGRINLKDLPEREHIVHPPASVVRRQRTFGYTEEEVRILLAPMARTGGEPLGAMGSDTPIAVLSDRPRLIFDYFTQQFAQVTNPPLDSIREEVVTSLKLGLGPERNLLSVGPEHARQVVLDFPVIDNDELAKIQHIDPAPGSRTTSTIRGLYRFDDGPDALANRIDAMCLEVDDAIEAGARFIVLSDRDSNKDLAPIPSLLMIAAVHHHLIRTENRMKVGIVVEAGDVREVHHVALLIGYGASAVNPYLAMETCEDLVRSGYITNVSPEKAVRNVIKALGKGVLKIMSKMGISTVSSYAGAQTFEAVGLSQDFVAQYFTGTTSKLGGIGIDVIAAENEARHASAYPEDAAVTAHERLSTGGEYQWRRDGSPHLFNPETIFRLQHATRTGRYDIFREYTKLVDDQAESLMTLRGMFTFDTHKRHPVPLDEVESVASIVARFATGAMSYGSISPEAHETLAIAMNRIGGKSNTGEGGEDLDRLIDPQRRSAVKQVASGRFGVTSMYLSHADDIQIKLAQGAKPGEGGQLPPTKVYPWIARTRHATAGVGLISPPPHHDIYSIEDLKQLIFDLKRANPDARIHTKLVSQSGIGAVAAGVAKALSDVILVSGHDGGTGASPLNSLKHAGTPWELGLAETQQTLMLNGLRDRVVLQVDGQLKTGRDVIIGALLGAEEFGFATAPLIVEGCVMMRVCHLDTCPVGVATQNPELRKRFTGKADHVVNFFEFIAQEVREYLAELGFRSLQEAVGHHEILDVDGALEHWKAAGLDLAPILDGPDFPDSEPRQFGRPQEHELDKHFDNELIRRAGSVLEHGGRVEIALPIRNTERAVGTMLGHEVTIRHGENGLPAGSIDVTLTGSAGQSFGAFLPGGITLRLEGDSNDYVGKGLSGGQIVVRPDRSSIFSAEENVIAGNVIGYGATQGSMFIRGIVGERFLVRNSGATAVVEGVGDHALEYMTGGLALILGQTGRNLGAGMSGGTAYVYGLRTEDVNSQALESGELTLLPLGSADREIVSDLLEQHRDQTDSVLAAALLSDLETTMSTFVKVLPRDYAAVLATRQNAVAEGLDPDGDVVWNRILEVTNG